jgi:hypothetical protein
MFEIKVLYTNLLCVCYWGLNSSFVLVRQALYHLSRDFSLFCSNYFEDRVLLFSQSGLDSATPILSFLLSMG